GGGACGRPSRGTGQGRQRRAGAADGIAEHPADGQVAGRRRPHVVATEVVDVEGFVDLRDVAARVGVREADRAIGRIADGRVAHVVRALDAVVAVGGAGTRAFDALARL